MELIKQRLLIALAVLTASTAQAQEWTVFELPAAIEEVPAKIQQQFGCTWQELAEQRDISHLKITGQDFGGSSYYYSEGKDALRQLAVKARELDFSEVTANPDWAIHTDFYEGPDPFVFIECMGLTDLDSLRRIVFPKTLHQLYRCSLRDCDNLQEVVWPDDIRELDDYMFANCNSLTQMEIPATVKALSSGCFYNCPNLQSVTLHEGLQFIGENCFSYDASLTSISLPQSVKAIGGSAFSQCPLTSVTLPANLSVIPRYIFSQCEQLASVTIPDGVTEIGESAFYCCTALKSLQLPPSITTIGNSAFMQSALIELELPDGVTSIGHETFAFCKQLRKVHLSRGLEAIPISCFYGCDALEQVNIPQRVKTIGRCAFRDCFLLPEPTLPEGLTQIDDEAFMGCRFNHIILPPSLQLIGNACFQSSSLQSIDVPASVIQIGAGAFEYCGNLRQATLHEGLLYLQSNAFDSCPLLEDVALPSSLRILGEWVFHDNKSKKSFVLPPLVNVVPEYICCGCENLASVTLHDRVTHIDYNAFDGCLQLTHIDLPEGLTAVDANAFANCPLQNVTFPSSLRTIGNGAFHGGDYSRVVLPEGVEFVGDGAFRSEKLRYVDFPSTISQLGIFAFQGGGEACDSIVLRAPLPPLASQLYWDDLDGALYVPTQSVEAYRSQDSFNDFKSIRPLTGFTAENVVVTQTFSTDSTWFPVISNANLTIAYGQTNSWDQMTSGHLHVGSHVSWPLNHLRYDYRKSWPSDDWETIQPTATLINEGTMTAQSMEMNLELYVNQWFFFTPPFDTKVSDLTCNDKRTPYILRTFDGAQRAAGNHTRVWATVSPTDTLKAGHGYIMQYGEYRVLDGYNTWTNKGDDARFNLQNSTPLHAPSLSSEAVTIPLIDYQGEYPHNEGWNLVGNPFMAYFDIQALESDAPILVAPGPSYMSFQAYSPLDDDLVLRPLEAFLVQRSATQTAITFTPAGRQANLPLQREAVNSSRSLRRQALRQGRVVVDATLLRHTEQGDSLMATTRVVVTSRATAGYDRGQDAPFIAINDSLTALYTRSSGLRYSLNEQPPTTQSVQVGMVLAEAGTYTLAVNLRGDTNAAPQHLWLKDKDTGAETDLLTDSYTFTIDEPTTLNNRFLLSLCDGITTVPSVATESQQTGQTYDLQGRQIENRQSANRQLRHGLYIQNGKKLIK